MKNFGKTICSIFALSAFLLIGLATSDGNLNGFNFYEVSVTNTSDSCRVTDLGLVYRFSRNLEDTLYLEGKIFAHDTISVSVDSQSYLRLFFNCECPDDSLNFQEIEVMENANGNGLEMVSISCE